MARRSDGNALAEAADSADTARPNWSRTSTACWSTRSSPNAAHDHRAPNARWFVASPKARPIGDPLCVDSATDGPDSVAGTGRGDGGRGCGCGVAQRPTRRLPGKSTGAECSNPAVPHRPCRLDRPPGRSGRGRARCMAAHHAVMITGDHRRRRGPSRCVLGWSRFAGPSSPAPSWPRSMRRR